MTDIPHFKEIVLMVSQCDHCGYKDSEVRVRALT
jgi:zinc finger protein